MLTVAPTAVGDVEGVIDRFGEYRAQLTDLVGNVVTLYRAAQGLPTFEPDDGTVRILHVSDIHLNPQAFDLIELVVDQFDIDAVADTGDITDWGTEPETQLLARIGRVGVPYVWVRGNHDSMTTQEAIAAQPNAVVLDGDAATVVGLRFWGIADARYTPNKDQPSGKDVERDQAEAAAPVIAGGWPRTSPLRPTSSWSTTPGWQQSWAATCRWSSRAHPRRRGAGHRGDASSSSRGRRAALGCAACGTGTRTTDLLRALPGSQDRTARRL